MKPEDVSSISLNLIENLRNSLITSFTIPEMELNDWTLKRNANDSIQLSELPQSNCVILYITHLSCSECVIKQLEILAEYQTINSDLEIVLLSNIPNY